MSPSPQEAQQPRSSYLDFSVLQRSYTPRGGSEVESPELQAAGQHAGGLGRGVSLWAQSYFLDQTLRSPCFPADGFPSKGVGALTG